MYQKCFLKKSSLIIAIAAIAFFAVEPAVCQKNVSSEPLYAGVVTRQISAENPTGEKGEGCKWVPNPADPNLKHSGMASHLGMGWKVRSFIHIQCCRLTKEQIIKGTRRADRINFDAALWKIEKFIVPLHKKIKNQKSKIKNQKYERFIKNQNFCSLRGHA